MFISSLYLTYCALTGVLHVNGLPQSVKSSYAVKERHVVPQAWTAIGRSAKSEIINLQIGLKQRNEGAIEQHLIEISDPQHPRYGDHLTAEEIEDIVSPADETVDLVRAWLREHDIANIAYSPARDWVSVVVSIEKAEELLQTTYSTYKHRDGSTISRTPEWSLPLHLHEHIDVIQPTNSYFQLRPNVRRVHPIHDGPTYPVAWWETTGKHMYGGSKPGSGPASIDAICNASFTTPTCLRTLYGTIDYTPKVPGHNQLGITNYLNDSNARSDVQKFLENFRPEAAAAAHEFKLINIANAMNNQGSLSPQQIVAQVNLEGDLDAELTLSIAWPTPLTSWLTGGSPPFIPALDTLTNTNEPYLTWLNYVLAQKSLPQVISTSYGDDEQAVPYSYATRVCAGLAQLGARGISVLFSSGDSGVGGDGTCFSNTDTSKQMFIPNFPASCPWVTTVGATAGFSPEVAVSRFGSGAGFSNYFPAPSYGKKTWVAYIKSLGGLYNGLYNKTGRGYPDVAAQGNHDAIVWGGNMTTVGGTSASSPTFAAVISLVNDALLAAGKKPLGFLNPWIYGGAYKALTDITNGSSIGCNGSGFPAQAGWDAVTGWGTPNFGKLVDAAFEK